MHVCGESRDTRMNYKESLVSVLFLLLLQSEAASVAAVVAGVPLLVLLLLHTLVPVVADHPDNADYTLVPQID